MSDRDIVPKDVKERTRIHFAEPILTVQSDKDECDINLIVERAKRGADISGLVRTPMYGDFTNLPSYTDALNIVKKAKDAFMSLDAFVRERFGNDPARMVDFLNDPNNRDEAVKLGLVNAPVVPHVDEHLETLKSIDKGLRDASHSKSKKRSDGDSE